MQINPHSLDDLVVLLPDDRRAVDAFIWNQCWKSWGYLRTVSWQWFGWTGATLQSVVDEIMKLKEQLRRAVIH